MLEAAWLRRVGGVHSAFGGEVEIRMGSKVGSLRGTSYSAMDSCSRGCMAAMRGLRRTRWFGGGKDSTSLSCQNVTRWKGS